MRDAVGTRLPFLEDVVLGEEQLRGHVAIARLTVRRVDELAHDAVAVSLAVPAALRPAFRFVPGQHVGIRIETVGGAPRRFSLAPPASPDELRVVVRLAGAFGDHVRSGLAVGDAVEVTAPRGRLLPPLDPARTRTYVGVAAGTGVVPAFAVAAEALAVETCSTFTLFCVDRTRASALLDDELASLGRHHEGRFALHRSYSREAAPGALGGHIDAARLRTLLATTLTGIDVDEWILCGPPAMVVELADALVADGVPAARIHHQVVAPVRPAPRERPVTRRWER